LFIVPLGGSASTIASLSGLNTGPGDDVTVDPDGNFYAAVNRTIFKFTIGSQTLSTACSFSAFDDEPTSLVSDGAAFLYGTDTHSASLSIFRVRTDGSDFSVLASIGSFQGPSVPVISAVDANGNVFGITANRVDPTNFETIFELPSGSSSLTTLASCADNATEDVLPNAGVLTRDGAGNIFRDNPNRRCSFYGLRFRIAPRNVHNCHDLVLEDLPKVFHHWPRCRQQRQRFWSDVLWRCGECGHNLRDRRRQFLSQRARII
jgi:hypothetical protein